MAVIQYPPQLPRPMRDDYGLSHVDTVMRTPMQSGRTRQRRVYTSAPSVVRAIWRLKNHEAVLFEAFFRHDLQDGVQWFECELQTPLGIRPYLARFSAMYEGPMLVGPTIWNITATLELKDRPTIDADLVPFPEFIFGLDVLDQAINREWPQ